MKKRLTASSLAFGIIALLTLPGCGILDWARDTAGDAGLPTTEKPAEAEASTVIARINGKPVLTESEFQKYLQQVLASNPYFKSLPMSAVPPQIKQKVFDRVVEQRLIVAKAKKLGFANKSEFKKSMAETMSLAENMLLVQLYEKEMLGQIKISDDTVKQEFEKNKSRYIKVAGGSLVEGARFDKENDAKSFHSTVKKDLDSFEKLARKNDSAEYKEFGRVSEDPRSHVGSSIPAKLREVALKSGDTEESAIVQDGDNHWVIRTHDTKQTVHFEFDEIKEQLEMMVRMNKFKGVLDDKLKELRTEFSLDLNEDFTKQFQASKSPFGTFQENGQTVTRLPVDALPIKKIEKAENEAAPAPEGGATAV